MGTSYGSSIVRDSLSLYLDAANIKSYPGTGTTIYDLSPYEQNNTMNGVTFSNNAFVFSGTNTRVSTNSVVVYGNSTTWEAVVKRFTSLNTYNMFMGRLLPYFGARANRRFHFSNNIGGQKNVYSNMLFTVGVWYHVVFMTDYDGTSNTVMKIFINGELDNSESFTGSQNNDSYPYAFTIGDGRPSQWYPFNGELGLVRVYNRALTDTEVRQNFNAIRGRFGL